MCKLLQKWDRDAAITWTAVSFLSVVMAMALAIKMNPVKAEMPEQPDTPLVSVYEIGPNWVKIMGHAIPTQTTEQALQGTVGYDPSGFNPNFPAHLAQVRDLGDYVCRLNDRRGIVLSQITEYSGGLVIPGVYYLVACATPN